MARARIDPFFSAFSVLIYHYKHFLYLADRPVAFTREQLPFYSALRLLYEHGHYGVQVFWCISGFIFFWKYKDLISERLLGPGKFFILRFSRLYPLHIVTLVLVLGLQTMYFSDHGFYFVYQENDFRHFLLQIFLASNWGFERADSFNGPIWSVSVEVLVYLLFFLALRYLSRSALINLAVLAAFFGAKLIGFTSVIFDCCAFFYIGGLSAWATQTRVLAPYRRHLRVCAFFILVVVPLTCIAIGIHHTKHFAFLFLLFYTPLLLYVASSDFPTTIKAQTIITSAGNMTYSSYLLHFPIQLMIALVFSRLATPIPTYSNALFVTFICGTFFVSYFVYQYFEMPAQAQIRAFAEGEKQRALKLNS
ncbi:acyltransferase family protein [Bradyrhizobium frederickii]|uniref:acyltransferase family protein n=1 Tax=Bradyrhizobium frederickii TaxID=2560054 RepID=UPI003221970D